MSSIVIRGRSGRSDGASSGNKRQKTKKGQSVRFSPVIVSETPTVEDAVSSGSSADEHVHHRSKTALIIESGDVSDDDGIVTNIERKHGTRHPCLEDDVNHAISLEDEEKYKKGRPTEDAKISPSFFLHQQ